MKKSTIALTLALSVASIGCASKKIDISKSEFKTRIAESGLKHFEVSARQKQPRSAKTSSTSGQQRQSREPRVNRKKAKKALSALASAHIEQNNFCRNGFWVMEVNAYGPRISLRGECNEAANTKDRASFPDTISQW